MEHRNAGFSTIEATVALVFLTMVFSLVFDHVFLIQSTLLDITLRSEARVVAKNNLEKMTRAIEASFTATSTELVSPRDPLHVGVVVRDISPCRRMVQSRVGWTTDGVSREVSLDGLVGSTDTLDKLGGDCGGNDFSEELPPSGPLITSLAVPHPVKLTGIDIYLGYAYVTAISNEAGDPDLFSVDLRGEMSILSSLDVGSGLNGLDMAHGFAFATHHSSSSQLMVIDVRNPHVPSLIASSTLPGVSGSRPEGWSIKYYDSRIYLGTRRTAGHEFHVFDVSSPRHPLWLGSREMNHNVNSIEISGSRAYLATSGNIRDVIVLDVNNPSVITQLAAIDLPGNEDGKSLHLIGNTLYLGRFRTTATSPNHDFYALDVSDRGDLGEITTLGFFDVRAEINALKAYGPYAFLATGDTSRELTILKTPSSTSISRVYSADLPSKTTGVDYENSLIVATTFDPPEIFKIELGQ